MGKTLTNIKAAGRTFKSEADLAFEYNVELNLLHQLRISTNMSYAEIINKIYGFEYIRTKHNKQQHKIDNDI